MEAASDKGATKTRARRIRLALWLAAIGLSVGVVGIVAVLQFSAYERMVATGQRQVAGSASSLVRTLDQNVDGTLGPLLALRNGVTSDDPGPLATALAEVQARHPEVANLVALDSGGAVIASTNIPLLDWRATRDVPRHHALGASVRVVVTGAQNGVGPSIRVLVDARVASPAAFGARLDADRINDVLRHSMLNSSALISVFSSDGQLFATNRSQALQRWTQAAPLPGESGQFEEGDILYAWAASTSYPLVVRIGLDLGAIRSDWLHQAQSSVLATLVLLLILNGFAGWLDGAYRRQVHLVEELGRSARHLGDAGRDLAASEATYRKLLSRLPLPLLVIRDDRIADTNRLAEDRLGAPGRSLVGRSASDFMDGDALAAVRHGAGDGATVTAWLEPEAGIPFEAELALSDYKDTVGRGTLVIIRDVTEQRLYEERLNHQATHDELTGLPNRRALRELLDGMVQDCVRDGTGLMVLFIDLDHFKVINDALGHAQGDQVLRDVALKLGDVLDGSGRIGRFGGDEFVAMLPFGGVPSVAMEMLPRIQQALEEPLEIDGTLQRLRCSIGVAFATRDGTNADTLIRNADTAMYDAKRSGRHTWRRYSPDMHATAMARLTVQTRLAPASLDQELALAWQTQHDGATGRVIGVEALLRWPTAPAGLASPDKLIPLLEETGAIVPIGQWVLREACRHQRHLVDILGDGCRVAVNISAQQLVHSDIVAEVRQALRETGASASALELELTESAFMNEPERAIRTLHELRAMGVSIALDDFGTGYSNLTYLSRLPLDKIKMDRHFTHSLLDDEVDASICRSIVFLARSLNLQVVAEGVETEAQRQWLLKEDCIAMQGYLFARPVMMGGLVPAGVVAG